MKYVDKLRSFAQALPITFESWIASLIGIVLLRTFFEQYSSFQPEHFVLIDAVTIIHYAVSYLAIIVTMMVILMFFAKINIREASAISIFGFLIILIAPIIDVISGGIGGHLISYFLIPGKELLLRFITLFGGHINSGITLGIQIETFMGVIFCYIYTYAITKSVKRGLGAAVAFYCLIFFIFAVPSLMMLVFAPGNAPSTAIIQSIFSSNIIENNINPNFTSANIDLFYLGFNKVMIGAHSIILFLATLCFFFLGARKKLNAIIKNSRPERIFYFLLLFLFGSSLIGEAWFKNWIDIQTYIFAFISFMCAWMFSVLQNDIYDEKIDTISNKDRPFISKDLSRHDIETASKIFAGFTFLFAYAASNYILFFVSLFLFIYFIYSNPPLRLKRFVIVNSFLVGMACLAVIMAGFFMVNGDKNLLSFPPGLVLAIIIFFTAVTNIRDIKDFEGDKVGGVKTLPVILGLKNAKRLIALTICFFFLLIPWYFGIPIIFVPGIIASILSWYFITQENYKEWKGFAVYMIYLILIIITILFK